MQRADQHSEALPILAGRNEVGIDFRVAPNHQPFTSTAAC
jgi:hypothetical protein